MLALGVVDANLDYALTDTFSLGASGIFMNGRPDLTWGLYTFGVGAIRATVRLLEIPEMVSVGFTVSAGEISGHPYIRKPTSSMPMVRTPIHEWMQPALNVSVPFHRVTARATVGPIFGADLEDGTSGIFMVWPNLELAYSLGSGQELTLGGNSLLGWRGTF
jgi:hypothetical protein